MDGFFSWWFEADRLYFPNSWYTLQRLTQMEDVHPYAQDNVRQRVLFWAKIRLRLNDLVRIVMDLVTH